MHIDTSKFLAPFDVSTTTRSSRDDASKRVSFAQIGVNYTCLSINMRKSLDNFKSCWKMQLSLYRCESLHSESIFCLTCFSPFGKMKQFYTSFYNFLSAAPKLILSDVNHMKMWGFHPLERRWLPIKRLQKRHPSWKYAQIPEICFEYSILLWYIPASQRTCSHAL